MPSKCYLELLVSRFAFVWKVSEIWYYITLFRDALSTMGIPKAEALTHRDKVSLAGYEQSLLFFLNLHQFRPTLYRQCFGGIGF